MLSVKFQLWKRLLQPQEVHESKLPSTELLSRHPKSIGSENGIRYHDIGIMEQLSDEKDIGHLIESYARGIMEVTNQKNIAFWITAQDQTWTSKFVAIEAQLVMNKPEPKWNARVIPDQDHLKMLGALDFGLYLHEGHMQDLDVPFKFALCIDIHSSAAKFIYRCELEWDMSVRGLGQQLESYLPLCGRGERSAELCRRHLGDFIGIPDRQFPKLSCVRVKSASEDAPWLSQNLLLDISWEELEDFAVQHCLNSFATVVWTSFAYILSGYLESEKVILGGIEKKETDCSALSSVVPVPILIQPDEKVESSLHRVDALIRTSGTMRTLPPELIRQTLHCHPSQAPYNALFMYCQSEHSNGATGDSGNSSSSVTIGPPISMELNHTEHNVLCCTLFAKADVMDAAHLNIMLQQLNASITAMLSHPDSTIHDLPNFFPRKLISLYSPSVSAQLKEAPKLSPFFWVDHWAASNPGWSALEVLEAINEDGVRSQRWTYHELSRTSNRLACWLIQQEWRNNMIAVCLGRSFMAFALVLAIWKSGNCYVPIAEDLPEARQVLLLEDSGATALFMEKHVLGSIVPPKTCHLIDINDPQLREELEDVAESSGVDAEPSDNCYLLYTSGSTGLPKGVLVSRGNLAAFTEAQSEYICQNVPDTLNLGGRGSYLAHASRAFDVHICEMVLAWRHGLRLVTAPRAMILDNLRLVLTKCQISHAGFVPSLLEHTGMNAEQLPDLRYLGVGGEKISETIIERFIERPSITLVNAYGPTEVTIGMTSHTVTTNSTVRNIGSPVGNITIHVLEPDTTKYVMRGQTGELCVTGDLVASGYHRRPDVKGFTQFDGSRMYRTGDIVRLMANDCIEYLGRRDSQAKVRGQRLELEEVSIAVHRYADRPVNVTSVVTPSPITKRPHLVTFISLCHDRPDISTTEPKFLEDLFQEWIPDVLDRCRQQLPAYMVPSALLPVSYIPVQVSGKADNRRLVALYESLTPSDLQLKADVPAVTLPVPDAKLDNSKWTTEEQQIRDIICSVASTDPNMVTKKTSIFHLGLDSLSSLQVASQMRRMGYMCSAADVLGNGTIAQLVSLPKNDGSSEQMCKEDSSQLQDSEAARQLAALDRTVRLLPKPIPNSSIAVVRPCLPLQESIVSISISDPTPLYVMHVMFRLGPTTSLNALRSAFIDMTHENEIFRTCFLMLDTRIVQIILKPRVVELPWDSVTVGDEQAAHQHFTDCQADIASKIVCGIERQPPIHVVTASSGDSKSPAWLMLSIHHAIFDGASMGLLLDRLFQHYTGETYVNATDPTPLYRHFLKDSEEEAETFWSRYLTNCLPSIVPTDDARNKQYNIITEILPVKLSAISEFASRISTTAPLVVETIWAIALAKVLSQRDVMFGRVMNGRSIPIDSVDTLLIPLITTVPARLQLPSQTSSLIELIESYTRTSWKSLPYQHTGLRAIQKYAQATGPLFNSMFSYIVVGPPSPSDGLMQEIDSFMTVDYPLALEVKAEMKSDTITLRLRTTSDPSLAKPARTIINTMSILLQNLISNGDAVIDESGPHQLQVRKQTTWDETQWAESEMEIRRIVSEIIGIPESQILKNSSFFALGIDSIISIRLARCLQEVGLKASSSDILKHASIGALYNHLQNNSIAPPFSEIAEATSDLSVETDLFDVNDSITEVYPCTPLQAAMIGQCLSSQGTTYVHHHAVTLDESIDLEQLNSAWIPLIEQADILRTSFHRPKSSHEFRAAVHQHPLLQWSHLPNVTSFSESINQISQEASYPDIQRFQRPPWHVNIISKGSQRVMVVTMHHCLYDGFSLKLLFECLEKVYRGIPIKTESFASAAKTIANISEASTQFWTDNVAGYHHNGLPSPKDTSEMHNVASNVKWKEVKVQTPVSTLQQQCSSLEVTLQTVSMLAFGKSLALLLGQRDVVFGHVVSGRSLGIDSNTSIIGPLLNTVPFRLTLGALLESTRSVLQHIQQFCVDSMHHRHASLGRIQSNWRLECQKSSPSLFDALFSFNKSESSDTSHLFRPYESENIQPPHYKLNVEFEQKQDFLFIRASSRDVMIEDGELDTWLHNLSANLINIVCSPDEPVLSFPPGISALPLLAYQQPGSVEMEASANHVDIIKEVLAGITGTAIELIHEDTSIFALGVDSILAIDVSARCRDAQLKLPASDILQGNTIRSIASLAADHLVRPSSVNNAVTTREIDDNSEVKAKALAALSLAEGDVEAVLPCLSGQVFYISRWLESGRRLWEFTFAFKSRSRLEVGKMRQAWLQLQERHSILRTSFAAISTDHVVQVVSKSPQADIEVQTSTRQTFEDLQVSLQQLMRQIAQNPSTLKTPPARICLVQHNDSDIILITLHHALYDAWTIPILMRDLESLYLDATLSVPADFSSFVHQAQRTMSPETGSKYWEAALRMGQPTILRSDFLDLPESPDFISSQAIYTAGLKKLEVLCHQNCVSMSTLLLLVVARSLANTTDVAHPTFGLFQSGRSSNFVDIHAVVGPTVNMLPFVVQDAHSSAVSTTLQAIQEDLGRRVLYDQTDTRQLLQMMKSSGYDVQFNVILNIVGGRLTGGGLNDVEEPLFTPVSNLSEYNNINEQTLAGETSVDILESNELPCKNNILLEVTYGEMEEALCWKVDYAPHLMSPETIQHFLDVIEKEMNEVMRHL